MTATVHVPPATPRNGVAPPAAPAPSKLGAIVRGQLRSPARCLFYGPEGVGKSSLAADAPAPIFLDIEGGADNIDAARYPFRDGPGGHIPRAYAEVVAAIDDLTTGDHAYQSVVIDTVDALEALIHLHICEEYKKKNVEDFGYGKGYQVALDVFRGLLKRLDTLRARRDVRVIFVGHSVVKPYKNPLGEDYDRYQLSVHEKTIGPKLREWCDVVGFVRFDEGAGKLAGDTAQNKRARGWSTGDRVVQLAHSHAWDAKARVGLPESIVLDVQHPWAPFGEATADALDTTEIGLRAEIDAELERLGDTFTTAAGKARTAAGVRADAAKADRSTLSRMLNSLRATATPTASQES